MSLFSATAFCEEKLALWLSCNSSHVNDQIVSSSVFVPSSAKGAGLVLSNLVAVVLAEATRRRRATYPEGHWSLGPEDQRAYVQWCIAVHTKRHSTLQQSSQEASERPEYERLGRLRAELRKQGW